MYHLLDEPTGQAPKPKPVTVDIANASPRDGLARRVGGVLREKGYTPGDMTNTATRRTSIVRFAPALADRGADVARLLGGLDTQASPTVPDGHIEVVLGQVYRGPGAAGGGNSPGGGDEPITSDGITCVN